VSSVAIRLFRRSHCSWRQSSFKPALPCEQALCPAGIWNHMTNDTCNLQPVWVTDFHGKLCHSRLPWLKWNAVFLIRHSTHQQRAWRGWQISPFRLPGDFCPHLFLASRPNTIILMFNRMVQEKVVFINKKHILHEFHWQIKILLCKLWFSLSMFYTVVWLYN